MSALPPMLPYLTVSDGAAAIEFYKTAFGAVEQERHLAPGSTKIMNACLSINGGVFMLSDDFSAQFGGISRAWHDVAWCARARDVLRLRPAQ